eukprot:7385225-Prymnesium_polylepis.1
MRAISAAARAAARAATPELAAAVAAASRSHLCGASSARARPSTWRAARWCRRAAPRPTEQRHGRSRRRRHERASAPRTAPRPPVMHARRCTHAHRPHCRGSC